MFPSSEAVFARADEKNKNKTILQISFSKLIDSILPKQAKVHDINPLAECLLGLCGLLSANSKRTCIGRCRMKAEPSLCLIVGEQLLEP